MPEPKLDELIEKSESVKNPLTFVKGGLLETEDRKPREFTPEEIIMLDKQVKEIKTDLQVFVEALQKVEKMEQAYPDVPFINKSEDVSIDKDNYQDFNREERKALDMSVNRVSVLVNRKNYEILSGYLKRLESLLSDNSKQ
jgi:hypothetical protein